LEIASTQPKDVSLFINVELKMSNIQSNQYFSSANKAVIDAMLSATRAVFEATENLVSLNFETAREVLDASTENTQALLSSKSPQEATALQNTLGKAAVEKAAAYSRGVFEVSTRAASELGRLFQSQFEELTKVSQEIAQKAAKDSPFSADLAQAAVKQATQLSDK
jgi:phasin family protein